MRLSSVITLLVVFVLFAAIEIGVVYTKYLAPTLLQASKAFLTGETVMVGTPVGGVVNAVHVWNGQFVHKGQLLFTITAQSPETPFGETRIPVIALHEGIVSDISATNDSFVQAGAVLARIIDVHLDRLFVSAQIMTEPGDAMTVVPFQRATVRAGFLNGGKPINAIVTNVDPFDMETHALSFQLRLLDPLIAANPGAIAGLPVQVSVTTRENVKFGEFARHIMASMFSVFAAQ
jgi:multidrug efflux pump subunit AcrA (membrane-fusion protein)